MGDNSTWAIAVVSTFAMHKIILWFIWFDYSLCTVGIQYLYNKIY